MTNDSLIELITYLESIKPFPGEKPLWKTERQQIERWVAAIRQHQQAPSQEALIEKLISSADSDKSMISLDEAIDIIRQHKHDQLPHPFTEAIKAYPELFPGGNDTSGQGALTDSLCDMYLSKITDENNPIDLTPQRLKRMESAFRLAIGSWYEEQAPSQEVMRLPLDEAKAIYEHYNKGAVVDYSNGATLDDADLRRKTRELPSEISVKYACSWEGYDIFGLFLADEDGSHCGTRIAQIKGQKSMEEILDRLNSPHTTEPVSVSLEKCARSIDRNAFEYEGQEVEHAGDKARRSRARMQAKTAAEAWGLLYVD